MLDHVFTHLITAHRHSLEAALLQRQAVEERFQVDVFLGDVSFETSYSLPGEQRPARIRVDTSFDWPTWSQTAYRSWSIGEEADELPELLVEIAFRVQDLETAPSPDALLGVVPDQLEVLGSEAVSRGSTTIEQVVAPDRRGPEFAIEVSYEGSCTLDEAAPRRPGAPRGRPGPAGPVGGLGPGPHRRPALHLPARSAAD